MPTPTNEKPNINYRVQLMPDPTDPTKQVRIPVIVDRDYPVSLARIVKRCINEGRIAGLKEEASESIALAICKQMYNALLDGEDVTFGDYFRVKLYLDGTVDQDGALKDSANRVNMRLMPGTGLKAQLSDFSWHNVDATSRVTIYNIQTVGGSVANTLLEGQSFQIIGSNLTMVAGDTVVASWDAGGSTPATATLSASEADNAHIKFAWPTAFEDLDEGTEITFTVTNHPDGAEGGVAVTKHTAVIA